MTIEETIILAAKAHEHQKDKGGEPYILHPIRVMLSLKAEEERIVALLHDVLEDTKISEADLRIMGYGDEIIEAVKAVTRVEGETYEDFIDRAKKNHIARKVKLADLADNMRLDRILNVTEEDFKRIEKYKRAVEVLR